MKIVQSVILTCSTAMVGVAVEVVQQMDLELTPKTDDVNTLRHRETNSTNLLFDPVPLNFSDLGSLNTSSLANNHHKSLHKRYHVAAFDFNYVSTPFIISVWIVFASIAKIGLVIFLLFIFPSFLTDLWLLEMLAVEEYLHHHGPWTSPRLAFILL